MRTFRRSCGVESKAQERYQLSLPASFASLSGNNQNHISIQPSSQRECFAACSLLQLLEGPLVDHSTENEELTSHGGFTGVDVADEDEVL
jgi:hypothetical protein